MWNQCEYYADFAKFSQHMWVFLFYKWVNYAQVGRENCLRLDCYEKKSKESRPRILSKYSITPYVHCNIYRFLTTCELKDREGKIDKEERETRWMIINDLIFIFYIYGIYSCFCCSATKSHLTLCDPMDCSMPGFPVIHYLLELAQTPVHWGHDAIQSSYPLWSPSSAFNLSQN